MEHVVFFPAPDGSPAFRRLASLEESVRLVEHLRNVEGVAEVSVHALSEVPLAFKTWYRVEMADAAPVDPAQPASGSPAGEAAPAVDVPAAEVPAVEVPAVQVEPDAARVVAAPVVAEQVVPEHVVPEQAVPVLAGAAVPAHEAETPASLGFFA